jgi:hypothetical protein
MADFNKTQLLSKLHLLCRLCPISCGRGTELSAVIFGQHPPKYRRGLGGASKVTPPKKREFQPLVLLVRDGMAIAAQQTE